MRPHGKGRGLETVKTFCVQGEEKMVNFLQFCVDVLYKQAITLNYKLGKNLTLRLALFSYSTLSRC